MLPTETTITTIDIANIYSFAGIGPVQQVSDRMPAQFSSLCRYTVSLQTNLIVELQSEGSSVFQSCTKLIKHLMVRKGLTVSCQSSH